MVALVAVQDRRQAADARPARAESARANIYRAFCLISAATPPQQAHRNTGPSQGCRQRKCAGQMWSRERQRGEGMPRSCESSPQICRRDARQVRTETAARTLNPVAGGGAHLCGLRANQRASLGAQLEISRRKAALHIQARRSHPPTTITIQSNMADPKIQSVLMPSTCAVYKIHKLTVVPRELLTKPRNELTCVSSHVLCRVECAND